MSRSNMNESALSAEAMKEQNARAVALMMETLREHRRMSVKLRARFLQAAIDFARLDPEGKTVAARMYAELCGQNCAGEEKVL